MLNHRCMNSPIAMTIAASAPVQPLAPHPGTPPFQARAGVGVGGFPHQHFSQQSSEGQFSGVFKAAQGNADSAAAGQRLAAAANARPGSTMGAAPRGQILAGLDVNQLKLNLPAGLNLPAQAQLETNTKSGTSAKAAVNQAPAAAGKTASPEAAKSTTQKKTAKHPPAAAGKAQGSPADGGTMATQALPTQVSPWIPTRLTAKPPLPPPAAELAAASLPAAAGTQQRILPTGPASLPPETAAPAKAAGQPAIAADIVAPPAPGASQDGAAVSANAGTSGKLQSSTSRQVSAEPSPAQLSPAQLAVPKPASGDGPADQKAGSQSSYSSGPAADKNAGPEKGKASAPSDAGTAHDAAAARLAAAQRAIPVSPAVAGPAAAVSSNTHGLISAPAGLPSAHAVSTPAGNALSSNTIAAANPHALLDSGGVGSLGARDAQWQLSPNRVEAGFVSSQNSWVSVVAQRQDGHLTAALTSGSLSGKDALQSLLPQLSQHLVQRQIPVSQLGVSVQQQFLPGGGSGGSGYGQGRHSESGPARLPQNRRPSPIGGSGATASLADPGPPPAGRRISLRG